MLEIKNVSKYYNSSGIVTLGLRNINLNFNYGEIVAITGESGSGKSTLLNVICGVDSYDEGEILFEGNETSYFNQDDMDAFRRKNVAFIYQEYNIIDSYTVLDNIMAPLLLTGMKWKQARQRAIDLAEKVGLKGRLKNKGSNLSGGEKQRCVIAIALASDAPILSCDEPTGNLDSKTGEEIISLIKKVSAGKLVLIVTHNYQQVEGIITRTIKLHDGEVIEDSGREIKASEEKKPMTFEKEGKLGLANQTMLALSGIKSAPKKMIFSASVLTVFSFFVLVAILLYLFIPTVMSAMNSRGYLNTLPERMIIYDEDHGEIDTSRISSVLNSNMHLTNAFYEDTEVRINGTYSSYRASVTTHMPINLKNLLGDRVIEQRECFVVFPNYTIKALEEDYIKPGAMMNMYINGNYEVNNRSYNYIISGTAIASGLTCPLIVLSDSDAKDFPSRALSKAKDIKIGNTAINDYLIYEYINTNQSSDKLTLFINPSYGINNDNKGDLSFKLASLYDITIDKDDYIVSTTSDGITLFQIPQRFDINRAINNKAYEITIYTSDLSTAKKVVTEAGYKYIVPSETLVEDDMSQMAFIRSYITSSLVFSMILFTIIAYAIMRGVYKTKIKDLSIMRAIGFSRRQMRGMIQVEMAVLGLAGSIIALLILLMLSLFWSIVMAVVSEITIWALIIYILLMQIFSNIVARMFNRRLFKLTVSKTIREAEL